MATTRAADPQQILQERDRAIREINDYVDLTQEAKDRRIAEVREWAQREYTEARETEKRQIEARLAQSRQAVFRVPTSSAYSDAESAQVYAAFRGAWADVKSSTEGVGSPGEAQETLMGIMDQAERTGDHHLARAVYHRRIDLGVQQVVDRYLEGRPKEAIAWRRYTEAAQEAQQAASFEAIYAQGMMDQQFANQG